MTLGQGQAKAAAATATAPPATATATGGARGSQQGAPTAAAAPTKKRNADWPPRRRTSLTDWLRLPPRPRPSRSSPDRLTGGVRGTRGRGSGGHGGAGVKPRWLPGVWAGTVGPSVEQGNGLELSGKGESLGTSF